jgi:hypothetical protein
MEIAWKLTRRAFLGFALSLGIVTLVGCDLFPPDQSMPVYRRSGRGRHVSNAAKKHNANHLYATKEAALQDLAHPGDRSKVVMVTISSDMYAKLFPTGKVSADLRHDL